MNTQFQTQCRHFNGYKPCGKSATCDELCPSRDLPQVRILVVHLEALGAVLRATSLLPALKRKFPSSHITWLTQRPADELLTNNHFVDRLLTTENGALEIRGLEFDIGCCIDKSLKAAGAISSTRCDLLFGYRVDPRNGAILPANASAREYWELGLDDHRKFFLNSKPETQLLAEALGLKYQRDEYQVFLSEFELAQSRRRAESWRGEKKWILGINTGCSGTMKAKQLTVDYYRRLILRIRNLGFSVVLLGGGHEDQRRNQEISMGLDVILSPTQKGLRDGLISVEACDLVFSGDSLGMHMGIALRKYTVAWFGPTCAHEIDFYGRGEALLSEATCSPCWKRTCQKETMCYDLLPMESVTSALERGVQWLDKYSLSKQPFSETSFFQSL